MGRTPPRSSAPLQFLGAGPTQPGCTVRNLVAMHGSVPDALPDGVRKSFSAPVWWLTGSTLGELGGFPKTIPGFDHPRTASSTAVSSNSPQNANRIRLSGRRLANATPAEIAAMPPIASGNPTSQST